MVNQEFLLALLKRENTVDWNQWRNNNPQIQNLDLSGVNLRGWKLPPTTVVGYDPKDCTLFCANLRAVDFSEADLGETQLFGADLRLAKLRGAKFDNAQLNKADFREADLSEVNLHKANLDKADFSKANLSKANLSQAILSEANFDSSLLEAAFLHTADLMNANLENANLYKAVLAGAWLSGTSFRGANLREANLVAVQARKADFTGAILTGACLQDWNISSETKLDDVICEYIYLKLDQQERRPSSGIFAPGEFAALFQKALETVDLIFADGIDWQAFFQSFQELRSQYDNLSIQAIEKKSGGAFVIRLEVPEGADKAAIESQEKELYKIKLQLQEQRYRAELQAKDGQISVYQEQLEFHRQSNTSLMGIVKTMAEKETSSITNYLRGANIANFANQVQDNASQTASNFTQTINSNLDDITKLITALRDTAQSFPEQQREEALVHLDDLQEDLSQPEKQKPQRIKTRLTALLAIATTVSGLVAGAADFSNNVLELSEKLGIELIQPYSKQ
ncbi:pentapeptide repeat-containing protein [Phormidesmis priestleyi]